MINIASAHEQGDGVSIFYCNSTAMIDIASAHNQRDGVLLKHNNDQYYISS